ncbi:MAG: hypothetical protein ABIW31_01135, partial [Novosphingobium sp.]
AVWAAVAISRHRHGIVRSRRGERLSLAENGRDADALPSPRENELQRELEKLRERIKVLERIATDANSSSQRQSISLAKEIEALRDK